MGWRTLGRVALTGVLLSGVARWARPGEAGDDTTGDETSEAAAPAAPVEVPGPGPGELLVGSFSEWGVYDDAYHVKDIATSGAADRLTHVVYAFGLVQDGECRVEDPHAAYLRRYPADESVAGVADPETRADGDPGAEPDDAGAVRGSFNQLRQLKGEHPDLRVLWSFGGWSGSGGYGAAAEDPEAFAESCHDLVEDPRWADVFDGIVVDWEYPNGCTEVCDASGFDAYRGSRWRTRSPGARASRRRRPARSRTPSTVPSPRSRPLRRPRRPQCQRGLPQRTPRHPLEPLTTWGGPLPPTSPPPWPRPPGLPPGVGGAGISVGPA